MKTCSTMRSRNDELMLWRSVNVLVLEWGSAMCPRRLSGLLELFFQFVH